MIHEGTTPETINGSNNFLLHTVHPDHAATGDALLKRTNDFVDIRDAAAAHVEVLVKEQAANQRYIVAAGTRETSTRRAR